MNDFIDDTRNAVALFDGSLVVGNHDSITLLGAQSQNKLRDYSRTISTLLLRDNDELDAAIEEVVLEIEKFEDRARDDSHRLLGLNSHYKGIKKEYSKVNAYIEQMSQFFQLQQAQLLKEIKLLERLSVTVGESAIALENCINDGKETLRKRSFLCDGNGKYHSPDLLGDESACDAWFSRLERRVDDLCISHTAALQNQAQIKLLYDNNLILLDRISTTINNTFPLWRDQMSTMLGLEKLEHRLHDQNQVMEQLRGLSSKRRWKGGIFPKEHQFDVDRIIALSDELKKALNETTSLEKEDLDIRKNFQEAVHNMERG